MSTKINWENMTSEDTRVAVAEGLETLNDNEVVEIVSTWAEGDTVRIDTMTDELDKL